jgi:hypothetical protein
VRPDALVLAPQEGQLGLLAGVVVGVGSLHALPGGHSDEISLAAQCVDQTRQTGLVEGGAAVGQKHEGCREPNTYALEEPVVRV